MLSRTLFCIVAAIATSVASLPFPDSSSDHDLTERMISDDPCADFREFEGGLAASTTLYHGTFTKYVRNIMDNGFNFRVAKRGDFNIAGNYLGGGAFYTTADPSLAKHYARDRVLMEPKETPSLLQLVFPPSDKVLVLDLQDEPSPDAPHSADIALEKRKWAAWREIVTYNRGGKGKTVPHPTSQCYDMIIGPVSKLDSNTKTFNIDPDTKGVLQYVLMPSGVAQVDATRLEAIDL